jgi:predicted house-cleaning noncanonical NTP pyrophosphatase (MazG superfamily)
MNANEIANKLMSNLTMEYDCDKYMEQAAAMLRQQFDTIADLQTTIKFLEEECKALRNQVTKEVDAK